MEKTQFATQEAAAPPATSDEVFVAIEPATGKRTPLRELTDAQLVRHGKAASDQHQLTIQKAMKLLFQAEQLARAASAMAYELDRRQRSVAIASTLP